MDKGITLIETLIVSALFAILSGVLVSLLTVVIMTWPGLETRVGIQAVLDRAVEKMVRDLRETKEVKTENDGEIRFTKSDPNIGDTHHIYYFYHEDESYPPVFSEDLYQLRKASLNTDIDGTFNYDDPNCFIAGSIVPPDTLNPSDPNFSNLSVNNKIVTIRLRIQKGDEIMQIQSKVYPRNL